MWLLALLTERIRSRAEHQSAYRLGVSAFEAYANPSVLLLENAQTSRVGCTVATTNLQQKPDAEPKTTVCSNSLGR
jgi:RNase P protein component